MGDTSNYFLHRALPLRHQQVYKKPLQNAARRGYSIAEILLAIWLLTFVGGAIVALFSFLAKSQAQMAHKASGELLAAELLERASQAGPPNWGVESLSGTRIVPSEQGGEEKIDWTLEPEMLERSDLGMYYQLTVKLDWTAHKDSPEQGKRTMVKVRHVYLEDI